VSTATTGEVRCAALSPLLPLPALSDAPPASDAGGPDGCGGGGAAARCWGRGGASAGREGRDQ